jgi:hypothetical protein
MRNAVRALGFHHGIANGKALAIGSGSHPPATFQIHYDDLKRCFGGETLRRGMHHGLCVNGSGPHLFLAQYRNDARSAAAAKILRETDGIPLQLALTRFSA